MILSKLSISRIVCHRKSYVAKKLDDLGYILVAKSLGISSTTFTQYTPEAAEFGEITQKKGHFPFKVIQGHRFWSQSKAHYTASY